MTVRKREYIPVSFQGFGDDPTEHPESSAASQITQEAIRRGKSIVVAAGGDEASSTRYLRLGALSGRAIMAVPLMTDERIFGGIYVDKSLSLGRFGSREESLLEIFARHVGVAFQNRRHLDVAIREPITGFFTPSYFTDRLREAYRWFNLHGRMFTLVGFHIPVLDNALSEGRELGERLAVEISEVLPKQAAVSWGNPVLYVLLDEVELGDASEVAERVASRLASLLGEEEVAWDALPPEAHYQQGADIYFELRRRLLPEDCDQKTLTELRSLLSRDVTIKEAKRTLERQIIERTLRKTNGNITHAAKALGIHRPQLSNLLKKHALKRELFEQGDDEFA